jgi:AcrR family transcriptional regulator
MSYLARSLAMAAAPISRQSDRIAGVLSRGRGTGDTWWQDAETLASVLGHRIEDMMTLTDRSVETAQPNTLAILDAAERVFGTHGFDGGSMREISTEAGVAQALLHYHYKNKDRLYEAVFERRAEVISKTREARLQSLFDSDGTATLEGVLDILFMSLEELLGEQRSDMNFYLQMLAEVTISSKDRSKEIVKRFYDPSAEQFIRAFREVLPSLSRDEAVWAYLFAIGARMQAHAPNDRAERLGAEPNSKARYRLLIPFVCAGITAMAAKTGKGYGAAA